MPVIKQTAYNLSLSPRITARPFTTHAPLLHLPGSLLNPGNLPTSIMVPFHGSLYNIMVAGKNKHVSAELVSPYLLLVSPGARKAPAPNPTTSRKRKAPRHFNQYITLTGLRCSKGAIKPVIKLPTISISQRKAQQ
jgi:hypothetical protein